MEPLDILQGCYIEGIMYVRIHAHVPRITLVPIAIYMPCTLIMSHPCDVHTYKQFAHSHIPAYYLPIPLQDS